MVGTVVVTSTAWIVYGLPSTVAAVVHPAANLAALVSGNMTALAVALTGALDDIFFIAPSKFTEDFPAALIRGAGAITTTSRRSQP